MSGEIRGFEDTIVWREALKLTKRVYALSEKREFKRDWGLKDQVRRATISIMANIAEGSERGTSRDFVHFLDIAIASCSEVKSHLYLATELAYLEEGELRECLSMANSISRQIRGLQRHLRETPVK